MDDVRIGRILRALRLRLGLRQVDVARAAGCSQALVSLVERGHLASVSVRQLRAIFAAVGASYEGQLAWRGGAIDRLLDERHAELVGARARRLRRLGWDVDVEVTFNEFGDRGSIDLLATRRTALAALVEEIKTELTAIDGAVRRLDVKERLASKIVFQRQGWRPASVGRLVVVLESSTNRRRVGRHRDVLASAFPASGSEVRGWLRRPAGRCSGLLFLSPTNGRGTRRRRHGVSPPRSKDRST